MVTNTQPKLGIVQGRLVPPVDGKIQAFPKRDWEREFALAREAGFDGLEWIFDDEENPLFLEEGRRRIRELMQVNHIEIPSVSADYLMFNPIFGASKTKSVQVLKRLIEACAELGILRITVPLEDQSELRNLSDVSDAIDSLKQCLPLAEKHTIVLATESSLPPMNFLAFMKKVDHPLFKINYDLGNSCASGFPTDLALRLLAPYLSGIHIKDRKQLYGETVTLGKGDTDFKSDFVTLKDVGYRGWYIIQGARGEDHMEVAKTYLNFVRNLLSSSVHE